MITRKRQISQNECLMYQIIESCLKLDLDQHTAISVINIILNRCNYLFEKNSKTIRIKKMDYRNYRRYVNELKKMSSIHKEFYKEIINQGTETSKDNPFSTKKPNDIIQLENLLFLISSDPNPLYKKYIVADTDDLVMRALIHLDKSYVF